MTQEDKVIKLTELLKRYEKYLKVWETTQVEVMDGYLYLMFLNPKSKNIYSSLIKEIPIGDIDKIIDSYETKLKKYEQPITN